MKEPFALLVPQMGPYQGGRKSQMLGLWACFNFPFDLNGLTTLGVRVYNSRHEELADETCNVEDWGAFRRFKFRLPSDGQWKPGKYVLYLIVDGKSWWFGEFTLKRGPFRIPQFTLYRIAGEC